MNLYLTIYIVCCGITIFVMEISANPLETNIDPLGSRDSNKGILSYNKQNREKQKMDFYMFYINSVIPINTAINIIRKN